MEVVTKITTAMGALVSIGGLGWAFLGAIEFFQGKKNSIAQQTDNGMVGYNCCCNQLNSILKGI